MFSVLIRLALTAGLAALAALAASNWQNEFQRQADYGFTNFLISGCLVLLAGLAGAIWTYRTKAFGIASRAVLTVPLAGFVVFVVRWVQPFHLMPFSGTAFFVAMIVACILLIVAMWSFWPKKP